MLFYIKTLNISIIVKFCFFRWKLLGMVVLWPLEFLVLAVVDFYNDDLILWKPTAMTATTNLFNHDTFVGSGLVFFFLFLLL